MDHTSRLTKVPVVVKTLPPYPEIEKLVKKYPTQLWWFNLKPPKPKVG